MQLQISIKIYDMSIPMSVSETSQCYSHQMFSVNQRIQVLLRHLNPAIEITDVKFLNDSMISFELDSSRVSAGQKIIVAQAGSQVPIVSLASISYDVNILPGLPSAVLSQYLHE